MSDVLIDSEDLAKRLYVADTTLRMWRLKGVGPRFLKVGRRILYREAAVGEWLASRECQSTSECNPYSGRKPADEHSRG